VPGVLIRNRRQADGSWKRIQVSPSITEVTGHTVAEAMEEHWLDGLHPPDLAQRVAAFFSGQDWRFPMEHEFLFQHKLGHLIWIRRRSRSYQDENGVQELVSVWNDITDQKNLLLERENLTVDLQRVINTMPGVMMRLRKNEQGRWVRHFMSASVEALTGFTVEEALRSDWLPNNLHPADRASMLAVLAEGDPTVPATTYFRFRHKQGHTIWIHRNTSGYVDENGKREVISIWNDITAERHLTLEREALASDLQRVITTMPGVLMRIRKDDAGRWGRHFISPSVEALTGFTVEEAQEPDWWLHNIDPADRERMLEVIYKGERTKPTATDFRFRHKRGHTIWIRRTSSGHVDVNGVLESISIWNDITAERRLLMEREELSKDLQAVITAMPGVLIRIREMGDGSWRRTYVGPEIEEMTGYSVDEALRPEWVYENLPPAEKGLVTGQVPWFTEHQFSLEFRFRHKKGHWIWIRRTARSHVLADGRRETIAVFNDVTREKRLSEQLAQSAKLAQLGEVATGMAHELNQPLAAISIAAESAMRSLNRLPEPPKRALEKLDIIVELTRRAADIIDHMRIFGRSEVAGRGPVSVAEVLRGAGQLLAPKLDGGGVRLQVALPEALPDVLGKCVPLEQVIMNLISNACDAYAGRAVPVPPERRVIAITVRADADWVAIEMQDAAGGVPVDVLPRIFEPFFTTKPVGQGTGLGLSISYGIISDMGGTIAAENHGDGCMMRILLPVAR
jgi:PAS domain S-box-containing protein